MPTRIAHVEGAARTRGRRGARARAREARRNATLNAGNSDSTSTKLS